MTFETIESIASDKLRVQPLIAPELPPFEQSVHRLPELLRLLKYQQLLDFRGLDYG